MEVINALGRRKSSVARIYMTEGTGKITINKRDLTEYFPSPILQYAAHVGVSGKLDAVEVVNLALVDIGDVPQVAHGGEEGVFAVGGEGLDGHALVRGGVFELIYYAQSFFSPIYAGEVFKVVHAFLLFEAHQFGACLSGSEHTGLDFVFGGFGRCGGSGSGACGRCRLGGSGLRLALFVLFGHACSSCWYRASARCSASSR